MESSQTLDCTDQEWSGNSSDESGWTAYICSPTQQNGHYGLDDDGGSFMKWENCKIGNYSYYNNDDGTESDDSMNSDASSAPTRLELRCKSNDRNVIFSPFKNLRTQYSARKNNRKQGKKIEVVKPRIAKQASKQFQPKSSASHVNVSSKTTC